MYDIHFERQGQNDKPLCQFNLVKRFTGVVLKIIFISLIIFLLLASTQASAARYGDINGDGRIDVNDVVLVMRHALGMESLDGERKARADVNGDGVVNVQDVSLIMQKSLGLIDSFPGLGSHLVDEFIVADGISPGNKFIIVTLDVSDPESYRVSLGGNDLVYSESIAGFIGEVDEADAVREKVRVYQR